MPIWDPADDLTFRNFEDLNGDGLIEVSVHADPIIGVQAKVDLSSNLGASYEFLKASGRVGISRIKTYGLGFGLIYENSLISAVWAISTCSTSRRCGVFLTWHQSFNPNSLQR